MKTVVKIDPDKEYNTAKCVLNAVLVGDAQEADLPVLDKSIDNLKTVIDVLRERLGPKRRKRPPKKTNRDRTRKRKKDDEERIKLPSEKFPDLEIEEKIVREEDTPSCVCCKAEMRESGLYKTSEKLEVIPKKYHIIRTQRIIYNCSNCHGSLRNAKALPSIIPKSNYGDSLIIDIALSKYADLIPIERQSSIISREGLIDIPANSMIDTTHALAKFFKFTYEKIKIEVIKSLVLRCDETPHKMLEGDEKRNWYLWGFFSEIACYFEARDTRSGDIPLEFLKLSQAIYLLTDGYAGYKKALDSLKKEEGRIVTPVFCNAHAFRYFEEASVNWASEAETFLSLYGEIYELERQTTVDEEKRLARQEMLPLFKEMAEKCEEVKASLMPHSSISKAVNYFLNHYEGLTECTKSTNLSLDNNSSERSLRSPVVGRKTWYGTHSKRGASTNAILFSIVESCKINRINPRRYFPDMVERIHQGKEPLTPYEYATFDSG